MSPMCQYSSPDRFANNWQIVHYGSRALGGAGLIMQEAMAVSPEGPISSGDAGLWGYKHIAGFTRIVNFIHLHGAFAGIQVAHTPGSIWYPDSFRNIPR